MKNSIHIGLLVSAAFVAGYLMNGIIKSEAVTGQEKKPLYWVAPMDASYQRDEPGKSPMGMDLLPVYAEDGKSSNGMVKVSSAVTHNLGIKVDVVKKENLIKKINAAGYVQFDEDQLFHVHMRVEGWIEELDVNSEGEYVEQGQKLFSVYSPALIDAQYEYIEATTSSGSRLIAPSQQKLLSLGVDKSLISVLDKTKKVQQLVSVYAAQSGYISELNVRKGMYVSPATEIMAIGELNKVWVIAEIFEQQFDWLAIGQKVVMSVDGMVGRRWQGEIDYVYPALDPITRTLQVRMVFDNQDEKLRPNMFASLVIDAGEKADVLVVPAASVLKDGQGSRIVKAISNGVYQSVWVKTGLQIQDKIEIIDGLIAGDKVVVSGQFLLDSESNISAELQRMDEGALMIEHDRQEHEL